MIIYLARHGKTPSASKMRLAGDIEGLSPEGISEAQRAAHDLKRQLGAEPLTRIIVSPRKRTLETANVIADIIGFQKEAIEYDECLAERDCGPYTGQLIADTFSKNEEELIDGGMESLSDLYARTDNFYTELLKTSMTGTVLLVGHSGNVAPLVFATKRAKLGDSVEVSNLPTDKVMRLQ
jgi:probable phosphoglycerate mutase/uncharacterized phosphatase